MQFHWENRGYASFEQFLSDLASAKRKKIRQERRRVQEAGVRLRRLVGDEIQDEHWRFFTRCYNGTYRAHHSTPYLNLEFFKRLAQAEEPRNEGRLVEEFEAAQYALLKAVLIWQLRSR